VFSGFILLSSLQEAGLDGELVRREAERLTRQLLRHTVHLIEDASAADWASPKLNRTFTLTHTGFSRALGDWLVRENTNPDLSLTLNVTGHRDTSGLDLARCK
jgi:hypothetical protein